MSRTIVDRAARRQADAAERKLERARGWLRGQFITLNACGMDNNKSDEYRDLKKLQRILL